MKQYTLPTPLGDMIAIADQSKLYLLQFADNNSLEDKIKKLVVQSGSDIAEGRTAMHDSIARELDDYFAGTLHRFTTPIGLKGTPFQEMVWTTLQAVPYGTTASYAQLATAIASPSAFRAVANTNRLNRLAIIVPCHRIIKQNGDLCGYDGGIARKQWLLDHESSHRLENKG